MLTINTVPAQGENTRGFFNDSGPIEITSDKLTADSENNKAVFEGNVVAKQGKTILKAQWMEVRYTEKGEIKSIHAKGAVSVENLSRKITSAEVIYYKDRGMIVFTGSPEATDRNTIIKGTKITYYLDSGNSVVENSYVIIKKTEDKDGT
ncbi:MAG: hypothetical protein GXO99_04825 [Nitrospirae bacterium]|nr:hypothetical protein [Nitrospirota bacterium]